jgi:NADPH:quinone reductase-like Zn-dependent oxidoreductase
VLIYGASGSVGTYAVQLARHFGAMVSGVCGTAGLDMVRSLGAVQVFDYTKEDFSTSGVLYDVIFDTVGKCTKAQYTRALAPNGSYVTMAKLSTKQSLEELTFINGLIEAGEVKAVIDRCFPLEDMVEAHRYIATGSKSGNVVIQVV